jgi:hypothetical protein
MLEKASEGLLSRPEAVKIALQAAPGDQQFRDLIARGDTLRGDGQFEQAEACYGQALRLFPLHGRYRVQYAHILKDQRKDVDAFVHYCFSLSTGAPLHEVAEHLLFVARRADIPASLEDVERLAAAWTTVNRTTDLWDAPPVENDFLEFARLFWGNEGLITTDYMKAHVMRCTTRRELFISFMRSPETLRANPQLFVLMRERGLADV